ncbi:hypothetical protein CTA1_774 [Colletotrichum tanaceti]|uniref:Uncharacterized protein n=1 Tax=Colletotrichum tanaceti TaxID=1306861 RepID=A0A4U6XQE1_9PEZI|nr:hypothetical protein CTA1_774 [Colletotrichum tanaceti]
MSKTQPPLIKAAIASTLLLTVPDAVNLFVESGADPNEPHVLNRDLPTPQEDPYGAFTGWTDRHTPITWYCAEAKNHQRDMLTKLLEAGADPSKLDPMGISPLHSVLKHDEDLHQFRGSGINPYRKKDCVEALVKFGADVNARDPRGWTPLHHLCWARGLSIDEKNIDQDDGCNDKNEEIFLRELTQRARSSSLALGEGEEGKEDKEEKEDESWEAFPFASMAISDQCIIGNMRLIAGILMDAGADAGAKTTAAGSHESDDSPSEAGMTPFQVALYCENIVMVRYLRAKGLDFH